MALARHSCACKVDKGQMIVMSRLPWQRLHICVAKATSKSAAVHKVERLWPLCSTLTPTFGFIKNYGRKSDLDLHSLLALSEEIMISFFEDLLALPSIDLKFGLLVTSM